MKKVTKNMMAKYSVKGIATRRASIGSSMIFPPLRENMTKMVKSNAMGVSNDTFGINFLKYQASDFALRNHKLDNKPDRKGIPN